MEVFSTEKEILQNLLVSEGDIIVLIKSLLQPAVRSPQIRAAVYSVITVLSKNPQSHWIVAHNLTNLILDDLQASLTNFSHKSSNTL